VRQAITTLTSRYVALRVDDVDTDQIIPARFLTTTARTGLGEHLFHDWRYLPSGEPNPAFVLNDAAARSAEILVTGRNFGCGSSREHAVWALMSAGFRAVLSESFADIFRANAIGNGLLPVQVSREVIQSLLDPGAGERVEQAESTNGGADATTGGEPAALHIDLAAQRLSRGGVFLARFPIAPFAKHCLMRGIDELEFLLDAEAHISAFETCNDNYAYE